MSDTHTDSDTDPEAKTEAGAKPDTGAKTDADAKPDTGTTTDADTKPDIATKTDSGSGTADPDPAPDADASSVAESPDDNGLPARLEAAAPRRWRNRATPWLFSAVLLSGGFLGGVEVQKTWGKSPTSSPAATQPGSGTQQPGFTPPSGSPGGGFRGETGQETTGTLKSVTTTALTIRTGDGKTRTVKIDGLTKIQQAVTIGKLTTGRPITVQGSTAPDGTVTATAVTVS